MGFLDDIKKILDSKKEEKRQAVLARYAKHAPVQDLPWIANVRSFGSVERITGVQLCFDGDNECFYMRKEAQTGPYKYENFGDIQYSNYVEFRYRGTDVRRSTSTMISFDDYFELISAGSADLEISTTTFSFNAENEEVPKLDKHDLRERIYLFCPLIDIVQDEETKMWLNDFCSRNDLLPFFTEEGELVAENVQKNMDLASGREE